MKIDKYFHLYGKGKDIVFEEVPSAEPIKINIDHELTKDEYEKLRKDMADAPIVLLPERKTGRWEETWESGLDGVRRWSWRCSECGNEPYYFHDIHSLHYCPNCGARMET